MARQQDTDEGRGSKTRRSKLVRVGRTRVGKGVFASQRYPFASIIGEIEGDVIDDPDYGSDYCMSIGGGRQLEPHPPFRYVNHSCDPNCEFDWFETQEPGDTCKRQHIYLIALREIKPDEELTIDYNWSAASAIPCRCQAPRCRGWIVDKAELPKILAQE